MSQAPGSPAARKSLARYYESIADDLGLHSTETFVPEVSTAERRRRRAVGGATSLMLIERDDVLRWEIGPQPEQAALPAGPRRARAPRGADRNLVVELPFELLPPNEVLAAIQKLDQRFSAKREGKPVFGLRRYRDGELAPVSRPTARAGQRVLLFVHGTFSNCDQMLNDAFFLQPAGRALAREFDEVLAFDHPTLGVSPLLNAFELASATQGTAAEICVVAHSRGGLVTRWWLEAFGGASHGPRRAVLVGSPVAGTSLAAPARIRQSLDLLTNIGNALKLTGAALSCYAPFLAAPVVLLQVFTSVISAFGRLPIPDAALAMVPGLNGQSRAGNNPELLRLRAAKPATLPRYAVIQSNFEPEAVAWKFWRYFRKGNLAGAAADVIFPGANDLVVDCESMSDFFVDRSRAKPSIVQRWESSPTVHHCNYFEQPETFEAIRKAFAS